MSWRQTFVRRFGPGLLGGVRLGDYLRVFVENRFAIPPSCWYRAIVVLGLSCQNTSLAWLERLRYGKRVADVTIDPPLFLLGHWRSGTTHLHNLLVVDDRFGFPNNYQTLFPHGFLTWERFGAPSVGYFMPERRPMDNMSWTMQSPQEEEFALALLSLKSPCLGWVFTHNREHYDRYLTFCGVSAAEIQQWKQAFLWFLKRLAFKLHRPLVLKSPPHTARIKLLLEMFPQARFVHIHRNPYVVFQSSRRTFDINFEYQRLQSRAPNDLDDWILRQYRAMYDSFFEERELIPAGHYHEMSYEDLERDPLQQMRNLYHALDLPDFQHVEPALQQYVATLSDYKKNEHLRLSNELAERISHEWSRSFVEWGYPT